LKKEKIVKDEDIAEMEKKIHNTMDIDYTKAHNDSKEFQTDIPLAVSPELISTYKTDEPTGVALEKLNLISEKISSLPEDFKLHPKLIKFFEARKDFSSKDVKVDWAFAESLAFGSLLLEGNPVRLSGQDSARGTFSQRHIAITDMNNGKEYIPLNFISENQAMIEPLDSLLSEAAVLGFEFGYSIADPVSLVLWEAQFGDFANAAQVIIDNFIASSYSKWKLPNNLVMLLPHGQEGQGSEHSSARLERFLILCSDGNMIVANPTTPAQYFHLLRRQAKSKERRPLIVMTPKSLLRHPDAKSVKQEFVKGSFKTVIDDTAVEKEKVKKIILTSGKVYYDLNKYRIDNKIEDTAIVRIEQYYPHPKEELVNILKTYANSKKIVWVQEEPENMGAMWFMKIRMNEKNIPGMQFEFVSRNSSPSPAPGSYKIWAETQKGIVEKAFKN
jgi:2-oxoglutarate dehydrogenase complex dehydrogenase (E1) component-like enzyme